MCIFVVMVLTLDGFAKSPSLPEDFAKLQRKFPSPNDDPQKTEIKNSKINKEGETGIKRKFTKLMPDLNPPSKTKN